MKIVRYSHNGFAHTGVVRNGMLQSLPAEMSVLDVLNLPIDERNRLEAMSGRQYRIPVEEATLLAPIEPRAMRDFVAFERHIAGMKKSEPGSGLVPDAWYEAPVFLFMNPWSVVGPYDDVPVPTDTQVLDFELELAVVLRRDARNVAEGDAADYIAGFCVMNDWSARDLQSREMSVGLGPSKGKDFATTIGPWITTPDELEPHRSGDRYDLRMSVAINGTEVGSDTSANMSWSFEQMIAHASRAATAGAGDVLASGTCSGGSLAEVWARTGERIPPPLVAGDTVTMTIDGIGTISNRLVESEQVPERVTPLTRSA